MLVFLVIAEVAKNAVVIKTERFFSFSVCWDLYCLFKRRVVLVVFPLETSQYNDCLRSTFCVVMIPYTWCAVVAFDCSVPAG